MEYTTIQQSSCLGMSRTAYCFSMTRPLKELQGTSMKQTLILTVGLPKAGKSTWCEQQIINLSAAIICPDCFRLAMHDHAYIKKAEQHVWANVTTAIEALFLARHPYVILDACSITRKSRDRWKRGEWETVFMPFNATKEECIANAIYDNRRDLIPVIERMANQFEPLGSDELILGAV